MKRIAIIGPGGAGKSTFAKRLGQQLKREIIHLDRLYWRPNWTPTPRQEWVTLQKQLIQPEEWIIDGNFHKTLDLRLAAADTIIFLDFPRWLCLWRIISRRIRYNGKTRFDLGGHNTERITFMFLMRTIFYSSRVIHQKVQALNPKAHLIVLRSQAEVERYLESLASRRAQKNESTRQLED